MSRRTAAVAQIKPLAWEIPNAAGVAVKKEERRKLGGREEGKERDAIGKIMIEYLEKIKNPYVANCKSNEAILQ